MDLDALFAEHHGAMYRYLTRLTGDPELAQDAVQDAFLRLAETPPNDTRQVKAWLFKVATNICRETLRTDRRRLELLRASADRIPVADPEPEPSRVVEREDLRRRVRAALNELTERERTILLMREEGFTHRAIARAVGTTTKSVGTLITRALKKLSIRLASQREVML